MDDQPNNASNDTPRPGGDDAAPWDGQPLPASDASASPPVAPQAESPPAHTPEEPPEPDTPRMTRADAALAARALRGWCGRITDKVREELTAKAVEHARKAKNAREFRGMMRVLIQLDRTDVAALAHAAKVAVDRDANQIARDAANATDAMDHLIATDPEALQAAATMAKRLLAAEEARSAGGDGSASG